MSPGGADCVRGHQRSGPQHVHGSVTSMLASAPALVLAGIGSPRCRCHTDEGLVTVWGPRTNQSVGLESAVSSQSLDCPGPGGVQKRSQTFASVSLSDGNRRRLRPDCLPGSRSKVSSSSTKASWLNTTEEDQHRRLCSVVFTFRGAFTPPPALSNGFQALLHLSSLQPSALITH